MARHQQENRYQEQPAGAAASRPPPPPPPPPASAQPSATTVHFVNNLSDPTLAVGAGAPSHFFRLFTLPKAEERSMITSKTIHDPI